MSLIKGGKSLLRVLNKSQQPLKLGTIHCDGFTCLTSKELFGAVLGGMGGVWWGVLG